MLPNIAFACDKKPLLCVSLFAIIDIETCGGKFSYPGGRITEICILVHDGLQVTERFSTLINPECWISPYFTRLTGITNEMVQDAPTFAQIARRVLELTENCIFVAHNVNFDYGFIKAEFASMGYTYKRDTLCTVRLSRKLLPGRVSYSLGNLCQSLGIENKARHRAEGDAVATARLFDLLLQVKSQDPKYKNQGVEALMARKMDKIKPYVLNKIPETCGVYYFRNREDEIIYIGKSRNMYNRAISHFNSKEQKAGKMLNDLYNADVQETGSELIALLLEAEEIKRYKPRYNRKSKADVFTHGIDWYKNEAGISCFRIVTEEEAAQTLQMFTSYASARSQLEYWIDQYGLCLQFCNLTPQGSVCFNHQIKNCFGICAGEETPDSYNLRAEKVLELFRLKENNGFIIDTGRHATERALVYIENGHYKGYGYADVTEGIEDPESLKAMIRYTRYYPDADVILRQWLKSNAHKVQWIKL